VWPGNVRELKNLIERHVALAEQPLLHIDLITNPNNLQPSAQELPGTTQVFEPCKTTLNTSPTEPRIDADLPTLEELERRYILKTLQRLEGNRENTARTLGINKSTLWRKLQGFEIE
jgi:DNA-binding NtrC family response regulator